MMASPGGTSSGSSSLLRTSSSEDDLQQNMDPRKRKRMLSNRESARRSRMKKQNHLDDLMAQLGQLRNENSEILKGMNITSQLYSNIEAENSILRAQMAELGNRLDALNEIISYVNLSNGLFEANQAAITTHNQIPDEYLFMNPWNSFHLNSQPTMY